MGVDEVILKVFSNLYESYVLFGKYMSYQIDCTCKFPFLCVNQKVTLDVAVFTTVFADKVLACLCDEYLRSHIDLDVVQFR